MDAKRKKVINPQNQDLFCFKDTSRIVEVYLTLPGQSGAYQSQLQNVLVCVSEIPKAFKKNQGFGNTEKIWETILKGNLF